MEFNLLKLHLDFVSYLKKFKALAQNPHNHSMRMIIIANTWNLRTERILWVLILPCSILYIKNKENQGLEVGWQILGQTVTLERAIIVTKPCWTRYLVLCKFPWANNLKFLSLSFLNCKILNTVPHFLTCIN